ncbi:hypothetical protein EMCRGX_G034693 [Ephydatia muelleri]
MGAMWVVVAAARGAAGEVVVGALVSILLVPVVGLVVVAAVLLLLLVVAEAALLLLLLVAAGAVLLLVGAALLLLLIVVKSTIRKPFCEFQYRIGIQQLSTGIYLPPLWSNQSSMQFVHFCKIEHGSSNQTAATVTKSVTINEDLSWSVNVHGHKLIAGKCNALCCVKDKITTKAALSRLVHQIDSLSVCSGNPDSHFLELADARKGIFHSPSKNMVAFIDSFFPVMFEDEMYSRTLRCNECELLVTNNRCDTCKQYRCTLRALHSQWLRQQKKTANHASISSHTNFRYLKTPERQQRIRRLRNEIVNKRKEVERLKSYVNVATEQHEIYIEEALEKDIKQIMEEKSNEIRKTYQADSFQCIFWNQQLELLKLKDKRQIRWHPMIIRWCLSLKLLSSASYHALRSSNLVILPSERTLRDYTNIVKAKTGFSTGIDAQLCHEANIDSIPDHEKYVCLVFDEVKIKEDLVFDKHSLELVGFVQIGDINTHLSKFESCSMPQKTPVAPQLATHMLSFMVSGIMTDLQFPYVSFPCSTISGDQLYSMINGQDISWQHLVDLYKAHRGPDCATLGLSILPKLKWEHIELNSYSKMRVDLAAQVLSTTVAEAFAYENSPHTKETERFVRIFDKFFDLMNTRNTKEFVLKRKPNLAPYINNPETEERLKDTITTTLETTFDALNERTIGLPHAIYELASDRSTSVASDVLLVQNVP